VAVTSRILQLLSISSGFLSRLVLDAVRGDLAANEVQRAIDLRNIMTSLGPGGARASCVGFVGLWVVGNGRGWQNMWRRDATTLQHGEVRWIQRQRPLLPLTSGRTFHCHNSPPPLPSAAYIKLGQALSIRPDLLSPAAM
jgi:hypothetical protein